MPTVPTCLPARLRMVNHEAGKSVGPLKSTRQQFVSGPRQEARLPMVALRYCQPRRAAPERLSMRSFALGDWRTRILLFVMRPAPARFRFARRHPRHRRWHPRPSSGAALRQNPPLNTHGCLCGARGLAGDDAREGSRCHGTPCTCATMSPRRSRGTAAAGGIDADRQSLTCLIISPMRQSLRPSFHFRWRSRL